MDFQVLDTDTQVTNYASSELSQESEQPISMHAPRNAPTHRIQPSRGWVGLQLGQLWEYRDLLYYLVWRDVKVRYKQTALGVAWVVIQPVLTVLIFTLVFGNLAKIPSENIPYVLFAMAGLVPTNYFIGAISRGATSLVSSSNLISKVYFPRTIIPLTGVLAGLVDVAISFAVLLILMLVFGIVPSALVITLPLFILLAIATSLGVSLWLSALNVQYRDVTYLVPFLTQFWMYATPVVYPASLIPVHWRLLYGLNPMAGVVEGFRWALFNTNEAPGPLLIVSTLVTVLLLVSGAFFFRRMEKTFADNV